MKDAELPIWNPFRGGYLDDPYEQLRVLREQNPVHKGINGRWVLFKYEDVKLFLTNPVFKTVKISQTVASKGELLTGDGDLNHLSEISAKWMLFFDPPEHAEIRSMVSKIWLTYDMTADIRSIVDENIEILSNKNGIDIVKDFANYIPTMVICKILGLPERDHARFREWAYCFNSMLEPFSNLHDFVHYNQKAREFYDYLVEVIRSKREKPDAAFITQFLTVNGSIAEPLSDSEVISVIAFLFFAGIETSVNLFGQSVLLLLQNPDHIPILCTDESAAADAIEELLRYVSPSQYTTRCVSEDIEIRGQTIKAGEFVMGATVSANRDEEIFENAEDLDLSRPHNPHLSFGYGLHFCLGARLARDEMIASLPALFRAFPNISLDRSNKYVWDSIIINRGLKSLPAVLNP